MLVLLVVEDAKVVLLLLNVPFVNTDISSVLMPVAKIVQLTVKPVPKLLLTHLPLLVVFVKISFT